MPFINDEQRKAAFARMRGKTGGGGGRRPPRTPRPPTTPTPGTPGNDWIMDVIGEWLTGGTWGQQWQPVPNGPGIPGTPGGPVTLTGGAIYGTPGSDWALNNAEAPPPNFGSYSGPGVGPYEQQFTPGWIPPETLAGQLWTILVNQLDVYSGMPAPVGPWDEGYFGLLEAEFSKNPGGWNDDPNWHPSAPTRPGNPWNPFE
jgi:hypothetical protein